MDDSNPGQATDAPQWQRAADLERLRRSGRLVAKLGTRQIALFAVGDRIHACNNRCPHEGFPLIEGHLSVPAAGAHRVSAARGPSETPQPPAPESTSAACRLTCHYHNWAFELDSGANVYGGDPLRVYPTRIADGAVWVDLRDPPAAQRIATTLARLREACGEHDYPRIARELARLQKAGADPLDAVRASIAFSHDRLRDGSTHAFAATAAWLRLYDDTPEAEARLICLQEAIGHMAWDTLREKQYPYATAVRAYDAAALLAAIEAQDEDAAVALLRGALAQGLGIAQLEGVLTQAALAHYADFGHSLIYLMHTRALIERLGPQVTEPLLLALLRALVRATREDLLPEFRAYADALRDWPAAGGNGTIALPPQAEGRTIRQCLQQLLGEAARGSVSALHQRWLHASALNLLAFDERLEQAASDKPGIDVGWLDLTHGITFGNAVRVQCGRFPQFWPQGLLQMALFAGRNGGTIAAAPSPAPRVDPAAFDAAARARILDHGTGLYIHSAHLLKTWLAARDEIAAGVDPLAADTLRAGVLRYLNARTRQKHTRRAARLALAFVARED